MCKIKHSICGLGTTCSFRHLLEVGMSWSISFKDKMGTAVYEIFSKGKSIQTESRLGWLEMKVTVKVTAINKK